ncbi:MAG: hypothetical protein JKY37_29880 [Nannocystaceae bacterium]|nr:hypothetical protein [Nannocystaceae bacterium]
MVLGLAVAPGCVATDATSLSTAGGGGSGGTDGATLDGRDDGDSHTSRADGPTGDECQSDADCDSECGWCQAGECVEDVGCCAALPDNGFGFRCSPPPWDDSGEDGPDSTGDGETDDTDGTDTGDSGTGTGDSGTGTGDSSTGTGEPGTSDAGTSISTGS